MTCGGRVAWSDKCYQYDVTNNQWQLLATMDSKKMLSMVVQLTEDSFWVIGTSVTKFAYLISFNTHFYHRRTNRH